MQGLDAAPVAFVDTLPALQAAAARLAASRELAVDLEDHSYRSYQARGLPRSYSVTLNLPYVLP
jgi:hypothetical protein